VWLVPERPRRASPPSGPGRRIAGILAGVHCPDQGSSSHMKVLVIHGAGLNMRGKVQIEVFGPLTLAQYEEHIRAYAKELGIEVEFFHSNIEGEVVNRLYEAFDSDIAGCVINPGGYTMVTGPLRAAV